MGLNSYKHQRNFHFKKKIINNDIKGINIIPHVKLKNVWFSNEQNKIIVSMMSTTFIIGLIIGMLIGWII